MPFQFQAADMLYLLLCENIVLCAHTANFTLLHTEKESRGKEDSIHSSETVTLMKSPSSLILPSANK